MEVCEITNSIPNKTTTLIRSLVLTPRQFYSKDWLVQVDGTHFTDRRGDIYALRKQNWTMICNWYIYSENRAKRAKWNGSRMKYANLRTARRSTMRAIRIENDSCLYLHKHQHSSSTTPVYHFIPLLPLFFHIVFLLTYLLISFSSLINWHIPSAHITILVAMMTHCIFSNRRFAINQQQNKLSPLSLEFSALRPRSCSLARSRSISAWAPFLASCSCSTKLALNRFSSLVNLPFVSASFSPANLITNNVRHVVSGTLHDDGDLPKLPIKDCFCADIFNLEITLHLQQQKCRHM